MLDLALYLFIISKSITRGSSLGFSTQLFCSLPYPPRFLYINYDLCLYFAFLDSLFTIAANGISTSAILKFIALINVDFILGLVCYDLYGPAYL